MSEKNFQSDVKQWLKSQGCFVMVITVIPGIPTGTSDIFFCKEGFYGWLECKAGPKSPFRSLQKEFIAKMNEWSYARATWPENWDEIQAELVAIL